MTEVSICLNERWCRHTGVFDGTQPRCRSWLLFTEVFMPDMQKMIQHILTAPCQLSRRAFWETDHIFFYIQEVCSFCTHPLIPKPIVFFTFYKLANCLIASQIRIKWTILPLTAGMKSHFSTLTSAMEMRLNNVTLYLQWTHPKPCLWDWKNPTEVSN